MTSAGKPDFHRAAIRLQLTSEIKGAKNCAGRFGFSMPDVSSPERYAPPHLRRPQHANGGQSVANRIEAEVRQFVPRDLSLMEQQVSETGERPINELNALLRRLTGDSLEEIDRVVRDLESVCDMLRNEGERVTRELASYASLSHSALMAMKVLSDSVKQWKNDPNQN
jgi:hypothetical protein